MAREYRSFASVVRLPSAFVPMAMSLAGLVVVLTQLALVGPAPQPDEGAAAHLWQLLMAGQNSCTGLVRFSLAAPGAAAGSAGSGAAAGSGTGISRSRLPAALVTA